MKKNVNIEAVGNTVIKLADDIVEKMLTSGEAVVDYTEVIDINELPINADELDGIVDMAVRKKLKCIPFMKSYVFSSEGTSANYSLPDKSLLAWDLRAFINMI